MVSIRRDNLNLLNEKHASHIISYSDQVDHVVIYCRDFQSAVNTFNTAGFTISNKAQHEHSPTFNRLIPLENQYIEILGLRGESQSINDPYGLQEASSGLYWIALATNDVDAIHRKLQSEKIGHEKPFFWKRKLNVASDEIVRFSQLFISENETCGLRFFYSQNHDSNKILDDSLRNHVNGAVRLISCILFVPDLYKAAQSFDRFLKPQGRSFEKDNKVSFSSLSSPLNFTDDKRLMGIPFDEGDASQAFPYSILVIQVINISKFSSYLKRTNLEYVISGECIWIALNELRVYLCFIE